MQANNNDSIQADLAQFEALATRISAYFDSLPDMTGMPKHIIQTRLIAAQALYHARYLNGTLREKDKR